MTVRCAWPGRTPAAAPSCTATRSLVDRKTGQEWLPLANASPTTGNARFWIYDSLLSEYAAMGFEYGYSVERADALVLWEAQFGDFADGAQTIIDEFISSERRAEVGPTARALVLLLPHGYEGQGPDHSSGAHRALTCSSVQQNNMTVARPT